MKLTTAQQVYQLIEKEGPKTIRALKRRLPDINPASISVAVSHNKWMFLRLSKKRIGVVGLHDHLLRKQKREENNSLAIFQRIVNCLVCGPMRIENIISEMPDIHPSSVEVEISNRPELFIRIKKGLIGRKDRDEYLQEKYERNN